MEEILQTVTEEVTSVVGQVDHQEVANLAEIIASSNRIFIAGTGRSGLAGKMFAMRLMHIGYDSYVVGETITPSISEDDVLILISGSGETNTLVNFASKASEVNTSVHLITTNPTSTIGKVSKGVVKIPAVTKKMLENRNTIQPLGSQFDQAAHLILDSVIVYLMNHFIDSKDTKTLNKKHANLE
ncbi:6-phospho-3-hexuloisomerase [Alkalibacillus silvisoli]|uniref:SIS domain-containing protein n=1 Tax=Alkalibacillus silvisoli TaxID=392823 RepID=A0ABP3K5I9_9BACI